ncbi:MAG: HAMP domain-containing protein [Nitrospirae bacterium]|nr:HAMP domain-containing protein [Nitrospirota bacterium]
MKLKIWHKMIIGIAVPSLIAVIGTLLSFENINNVTNRQGYVQIADDLRENVLEVRRNEKNFLLHKNAEYYNFFQEATSVLNNLINRISPDTIEEIGKDDFSLLRKNLETYSGTAVELYKNYEVEIDVVETVREEGRKIETLVATRHHAIELSTDFILNLRRLEKNYMLFRDKDSLMKLEGGLLQLKNITPYCIECVPYIKSVNDLFSIYSKSDVKINDLQATGTKLEDITNEIANRERQRIGTFLIRTKRLLLIALLLLCTVGPYFVYKTANYVVAPINRLAEITMRISEGQMELRAPIREHDETFSLAVSFNTMLDHLQLTHESLEHSMELLRDKQAQLVQSEKLASIGTLASGVAHELNNPLNNIYLASQTLFNEMDPDKSSDIVKESVKDIYSQTLRVKKIVTNLLEFAREKGPDLKKINLVNVINKILKQMTTSGELSKVNYKLDISTAEDIEIFADSLLLEQVFINIISNAIDSMRGEGSLNITIAKKDSLVSIDVSDTGAGIPPEVISRIFDPFFTTKEKGTGLGLAIVYSIVKKHNGDITVQSAPDKGTTFTITLPRQNEFA